MYVNLANLIQQRITREDMIATVSKSITQDQVNNKAQDLKENHARLAHQVTNGYRPSFRTKLYRSPDTIA